MITENNALAEESGSIATVLGQPYNELPKDLYIPPNALEVILESFTGPLDLLLYLIKKENIDILNIPITQITVQYMEYVELMRNVHLELAAEYLLMAAMLAEIKSKMLLPRPVNTEDGEEEDPRAELVKRLREYERFKKAAQDIDEIPRMEREIFSVDVLMPKVKKVPRELPKLEMEALIKAFQTVMQRSSMFIHHHVKRESLSVRERMTMVLSSLQESKFVVFENLFKIEEGKLGVVVTFMAILELVRQNTIDIVQSEHYGSIYLKAIEVGEE